MGITSACAQSYTPQDSGKVQLLPAEAANIIKGQLLLQFNDHVSLQAARKRARQCGSIIRVVIVKPALILVQIPSLAHTDSDIKICQTLPGLIRLEWNQKRSLRNGR